MQEQQKHKGNPRFSNLKVSNRDNLRHNRRYNNLDRNSLRHNSLRENLSNLKYNSLGSLKLNNLRDNLRCSNHNNKDNLRFNNLRDSSNPNNSILNLRASNARGNHNTKSLKENLKERVQNIESRRTRSLKTLQFEISVG